MIELQEKDKTLEAIRAVVNGTASALQGIIYRLWTTPAGLPEGEMSVEQTSVLSSHSTQACTQSSSGRGRHDEFYSVAKRP